MTGFGHLKTGILCLAGLIVSGCNTSLGQVKQAMPEREFLSFASQSGGAFTYACARGATEADTRSRGQKAHLAYEHKMASYGPTFAKTLVSVLDSGVSDAATLEATVNGTSDRWARSAALEVERQYRCLPVGPNRSSS
ncbi:MULTISPECIES: hypothetical protein [Thioclava]|uniref:Lipoprotein n=1 Tax=Thioclava litoralis TaxID=3076557 RepID=A0ABZ1DXF7_9RHOB|nr:hypothetical protein RPE78_10395 [Thioclava sp. FTW29]